MLTDVGAVSGLKDVVHAIHLLLIPNKVLNSRNDALLLHPLDRERTSHSLEHRIRAEAFPITPTEGFPPKRSNRRPEVDVDSLSAEFLADRHGALVD